MTWMSNRNVVLVMLAGALVGLTLDGGVFSVVFNLYLLRLDLAPAAIGQVNSVAELVFALVSIPVGSLGAHWGHRTMMLIGALVLLVGGVVTASAGDLDKSWIVVGLVTGKILLYIGLAAFFVNQVPFVAGKTSGQQRQHVFVAQSALNSGGGFIGALLGGAMPGWYVRWLGSSLDQPEPYQFTLWSIVVVAVLMVILVLMTEREVEVVTQASELSSAQRGAPMVAQGFVTLFIVMMLVRFLHVGGIAASSTFFNVYLDQQLAVDTTRIGWITAAARLMTVPAVLLIPWLVRHFARPWVSFWMAMGAALFLLPLAFVPIWWVAGTSYVLSQALFSMRYSSFIVYLMDVTPPHQRGLMTGAGEMAAGLSVAVAALAGGYVIAGWGYQPLFVFGGVSIALGTLLFGGYVIHHSARQK